MSKDSVYRWGIFPLWLLLTLSIFFRNPIPIDETRYLSVAWEMWQRNDFLVPYLNGHTYSHKPPLLFWLFHGGWMLFGVNEWWTRLVGPLCALGNLYLIRQMALKLWPAEPWVALKAPWVLIATLLWALFATAAMFDTLLTCFVMLGMLGLLDAAAGASLKGWIYFAIATGLGMLAKGPVILIHLLPTSILLYVWSDSGSLSYGAWFLNLLLAILAGIAIALCWALPAAASGGDDYAGAILWHQTTDRMAGTKIHARSFFWYFRFLPLMVFPWIAWPRFWQNLTRSDLAKDRGLRFCLTWLGATFLVFSSQPSKQLHYLIPMMPAFALFGAHVLCQQDHPRNMGADLLPSFIFVLIGLLLIWLPDAPRLSDLHWVQSVEAGWGLSIIAIALGLGTITLYCRKLSISALTASVITAIFISFIWFFKFTGLSYNLSPAALKIKYFQTHNIPVLFVGDYQGQFNFLGRLEQPITVMSRKKARHWARQHPDGFLISLNKSKPEQAYYVQPHREHWLIFNTADQSSSFGKMQAKP
ncbi:MAG: ArnT family glycosyltransferase [Gammaproteobacteria bacterium]